MPPASSLTVVLVARPGALRDAWRALLLALPRLHDLEQVEDAPAVLQAVARLCPALVVVDAELLKTDTGPALSQIRRLSPATRCVALVGSVDQQQALTAAGETVAIPRGAPAAELAAALERALAG